MDKQRLNYYCKMCGNKIGWLSGLYGSGLCPSCAQKGKKHSKKTKLKLSKLNKGKNNGNYKGKVEINCLQCNKIFKILPYQVKKRKFCSLKCSYKCINDKNNPNFGNKWTKKQKEKQGKITKEAMKKVDMKKILAHVDKSGEKNGMFGVHRFGENAPSWQGGISKEGYSFEFNNVLKEQIRKRDNYTCQKCGITEEEHIIVYGRVLCVHHIDYNKKNCDKNNLISLCLGCNIRANYNRNYWQKYFRRLFNGTIVQRKS